MPKRITPLSPFQVSKAKPQAKEYKIADGGGMYLLITPTGGKLWRLKYRFGGTEKLLALGKYPEISLTDARQRRDDAKRLLANGQDPAAIKKSVQQAKERQATTFEVVAREWFSNNVPVWSQGHADTTMNRLTHDVFPCFGEKPITDVTVDDVRSMLLKVGNRGAVESAARIKIFCGQIFRYAIGHGLIQHDPSVSLKPSELFPKRNKGHFAAITSPKELAPLLRAIDEYHGTAVVRAALRLAPMLFARPGELRKMQWDDVDLDDALWSYFVTKTKVQHIVPLPRQAVAILRELHQLTGDGQYVFPGRTGSRTMSENTINAALRYMGFDKDTQTGHGFRATGRTMLDEVLQFRPDFIEQQLAHSVKDPNGRAYNRTSFLEDRRRMMQQWADYLDGLKAGARIIPLKRAA